MSEPQQPETPEARVRTVLQQLEAVLNLQRSWRTRVSLPRFYLTEWRRQLREALRLLTEPP
jgi:hypothetical protein